MPRRTILIPLDGSNFSRQVIEVVKDLFDPRDVSITLLRAVYPPALTSEVLAADLYASALPIRGGYEAYSRAMDRELANTAKARETYRKRLLAEMQVEAEELTRAGYQVTVEVVFGEPGRRIVEYATSKEVDLIAMTTHGRSALGRIVLGSVAQHVVHEVSIPVLLLRGRPEYAEEPTPGERLASHLARGSRFQIAAATDGSTHSMRGLETALDLAATFAARMTILVVSSDRDSSDHRQALMQSVVRLVHSRSARADIVPLVGHADEAILQWLDHNPVDLLTIGAFQDRGAGAPNAIGSTAQRLIQHAPTSVLVVKGHSPSFQRVLACVAADDATVVDIAASLAHALKAELRLLHVIPSTVEEPVTVPLSELLAQSDSTATQVRWWLAKLNGRGFGEDVVTVRQGRIPESLVQAARSGEFDLIVTGSQSGPGFFMGSVANALVSYAGQSVLVVRTRPH